MKTLTILKRSGLALLAFCFMLTMANAQARYKHMPRVKIEKQPKAIGVEQEQSASTTTAAIVDNTADVNTVNNSENTVVASNNEEVVVADKAPTNITEKVKQKKIKKPGSKKSMFVNPVALFKDFFKKQMEKQTKIFKATENKKALMATWKLLMIIFFIVGGALILTAIILTIVYAASYGVYGGYALGGFWYLWLLGGLCITAAVVFLILGITGVMS